MNPQQQNLNFVRVGHSVGSSWAKANRCKQMKSPAREISFLLWSFINIFLATDPQRQLMRVLCQLGFFSGRALNCCGGRGFFIPNHVNNDSQFIEQVKNSSCWPSGLTVQYLWLSSCHTRSSFTSQRGTGYTFKVSSYRITVVPDR